MRKAFITVMAILLTCSFVSCESDKKGANTPAETKTYQSVFASESKVSWKLNLGDDDIRLFQIVEDTIIVSDIKTITAYNINTGKLIWRNEYEVEKNPDYIERNNIPLLGKEYLSTFSVVRNLESSSRLFIQKFSLENETSELFELDVSNGEVIDGNTLQYEESLIFTFSDITDCLYALGASYSRYYMLDCYDAGTFDKKWSHRIKNAENATWGTSVESVTEDRILILQPDWCHSYYCIYAETGNLAWESHEIQCEKCASYCDVSSDYVVTTGDGDLFCHDLTTGELIWQNERCDNYSAMVKDDMIVAVTGDDNEYDIEIYRKDYYGNFISKLSGRRLPNEIFNIVDASGGPYSNEQQIKIIYLDEDIFICRTPISVHCYSTIENLWGDALLNKKGGLLWSWQLEDIEEQDFFIEQVHTKQEYKKMFILTSDNTVTCFQF